MDFTIRERKSLVKMFMKAFSASWNEGDYYSGKEFMHHTKLAEGNEGIANKSTFNGFEAPLVTKVVDLRRLRETKNASLQVINSTPDKVYKLFLSNKAFNKPSLIEIVAMTMTNQLVFQGICPNFVINYYWDFSDQDITLNLYNEFINDNDFDSWARESHDDEMWFNALFQIMMGLIAMEKTFHMRHTDFHLKNIMVQKVKPGGYWTYTLNNTKYYLPNLGYVFLINDLGYAWIPPKKLYLNYHYQDTLQYTTKIGKEYFDMSSFIQIILSTKRYSASNYFRTILSRAFFPKDVLNILSSTYYKKRYEHAKSQDDAHYYMSRFEEFSPVKKTYTGSNTTLESKMHDLFHLGLFFNNDRENRRMNFTYDTKPEGESSIEHYNLDKKLKQNTLPKNFVALLK